MVVGFDSSDCFKKKFGSYSAEQRKIPPSHLPKMVIPVFFHCSEMRKPGFTCLPPMKVKPFSVQLRLAVSSFHPFKE